MGCYRLRSCCNEIASILCSGCGDDKMFLEFLPYHMMSFVAMPWQGWWGVACAMNDSFLHEIKKKEQCQVIRSN
jgi:hypothetical protein